MIPEDDLLAGFEDLTLAELAHADHVRLAWLYLRAGPLAQVLGELPDRLRRYATAKGAPQRYHATITWAFVIAIHERMQTGSGSAGDWASFAAAHPELFDRGFLRGYYADDTLSSALARQVFVLPRGGGRVRPACP